MTTEAAVRKPEIVAVEPANERELVMARLIDVPPEKLFRCWTDLALLKQWFCPKPWAVTRAEGEVRSGGASMVVMRGPDGQEVPTRGVYLEVIPNEKIVLTDAFTSAWAPSEKPFMVATVTFEDRGGRTLYTARVGHWSVADREQHEKMGFHQGWGVASEQLAALAATL